MSMGEIVEGHPLRELTERLTQASQERPFRLVNDWFLISQISSHYLPPVVAVVVASETSG